MINQKLDSPKRTPHENLSPRLGSHVPPLVSLLLLLFTGCCGCCCVFEGGGTPPGAGPPNLIPISGDHIPATGGAMGAALVGWGAARGCSTRFHCGCGLEGWGGSWGCCWCWIGGCCGWCCWYPREFRGASWLLRLNEFMDAVLVMSLFPNKMLV